jgi:two-component system, cell cycle sensor histidine kinase and response regulator CckA
MICSNNSNPEVFIKEHHGPILNVMSEGVVELNAENEIVYVNPSSVSIMGTSAANLLKSDFSGNFPEQDREKIKVWLHKKNNGTVKTESLSITSVGNKQISLNRISFNGKKHKSTIVILNDRSEQLRLEAQVQRAERMEAIGMLAGGVAHDLNNILSGLVSYPELLLLQMPDDNPLRKPIQTIQKAGERAAAVVQDLLTLARRGVLVSGPMNLNDLINGYLKGPEYEKFHQQHPAVHLKTFLAKDVLNISGSSAHLSKTILNLVANAGEAMSSGGTIKVSTENQYIDRPIHGYTDVREGDYVVLTVADEGNGISPRDMEKIFEPFYTKKIMGMHGTGLGMSVVWGTVQDHNGYIDIRSAEGKGTTFSLYFPVVREELPRTIPSQPIEAFYGNGETILIVDDVEEQRQIASAILNELDYSVESVPSGEEAVAYLKTNKVDLLVLDMIMDPGMDGLETYRKILELHPEQKAIIASGFSETDRVKEVQRLGAGAYVKKPFLLKILGTAVKEELQK